MISYRKKRQNYKYFPILQYTYMCVCIVNDVLLASYVQKYGYRLGEIGGMLSDVQCIYTRVRLLNMLCTTSLQDSKLC